jgi:hypothetical protein
MRGWNRTLKRFYQSVVILSLCASPISCRDHPSTPDTFDQKIVHFINTHCNSETACLFRLKDVTNFQWDKMYAFTYAAQQSEVENILGRKLPGFAEFQRKLIFLKNGDVVFIAQQKTDIEKLVPDEVVFDIPETANYKVYSADASFRVAKIEASELFYYKLNSLR